MSKFISKTKYNTVFRTLLLSIIVFLNLFLLLSCGQEAQNQKNTNASRLLLAQKLLEGEKHPENTFITWTMNKDALSTHLVVTKGDQVETITTTTGLLLPSKEISAHIIKEQTPALVCDCSSKQEANHLECTPSYNAIFSEILTIIYQDNKIELSDYFLDNEFSNIYSHTLTQEITAITGPYIYYKTRQQIQFCENEPTYTKTIHQVFDMDNKEIITLLNEEELAVLESKEKNHAIKEINSFFGFTSKNPNDITLNNIIPIFVEGLGLSFQYEFIATIFLKDHDTGWNTYKRTILIPAQTLPEKLALYPLAPLPLRPLVKADGTGILGWRHLDYEASSTASFVRLWEKFNKQH